ncbi:radical SAM protein [Nonomuraea sp. NPDC001684]
MRSAESETGIMSVQEVTAQARENAYIYDLSATLFKPETLFEQSVDNDRWVIFAPDFQGLPVLIDSATRDLMNSFENGAAVADVLARHSDFIGTLGSISALEERGFLRAYPAQLPYPAPPPRHAPRDFSAWLHITNMCNLKCDYCFVGEKTSEGMSPETMKMVAEQVRSTAERYGTQNIAIKFAGGEPTISVPRMELFRDIMLQTMQDSPAQVKFAVLSNGTLVKDQLLDFLTRTGTAMSISLDGYGDDHDIYRRYGSGRGSWKTVSTNIEKLIEHGIRPYIMATISQESCSSLPELVQWIYGHGLRCRLSIVRNPNSSWAGGDRRAEYAEYNATIAAAFDKAFTVLEDPATVIDLRSGLDLCELYFDRPTRGITCGTGDNHLVIKPDGTLVACPMTVMEPGLRPSGDLFATAAATFPHSPAERHYERIEDDCLSCKWFGVCSGGCPITNLRVKGHAFTRSPLCSFYKAVIPRYLTFFGKKLRQAEKMRGEVPSQLALPRDEPSVAGC